MLWNLTFIFSQCISVELKLIHIKQSSLHPFFTFRTPGYISHLFTGVPGNKSTCCINGLFPDLSHVDQLVQPDVIHTVKIWSKSGLLLDSWMRLSNTCNMNTWSSFRTFILDELVDWLAWHISPGESLYSFLLTQSMMTQQTSKVLALKKDTLDILLSGLSNFCGRAVEGCWDVGKLSIKS